MTLICNLLLLFVCVCLFTGAEIHLPLLDELDLLPDKKGDMVKKVWPFWPQRYTRGDECTLAGNRKVKRSAEVRFACSPTAGDKDQMHMVVREPDYCTYVITVYLPSLCSNAAFKPQERPTAAGTAAAQKKEQEAAADKRRRTHR